MGMPSPATATASATIPKAGTKSDLPEKAIETSEPGSEFLPEELFDLCPFNDNTLPSQWASATDDPYLGYDTNSALASFTHMDELRQQIWQNGDMRFMNADFVQDVL